MPINNIGRPFKIKTVEELEDRINQYFEDCRLNNRPLTVTGFCLALDTTRETIREYEARPDFVDSIKKAKEIVANYAEEQCLLARNPAGAIFIAKNHGFIDKQQVSVDTTVSYQIPDQLAKLTE